jgi:hypothetical protein
VVGCSETGDGRPLIVEHGRNAGRLARLNGISLYAPHVAPDNDVDARALRQVHVCTAEAEFWKASSTRWHEAEPAGRQRRRVWLTIRSRSSESGMTNAEATDRGKQPDRGSNPIEASSPTAVRSRLRTPSRARRRSAAVPYHCGPPGGSSVRLRIPRPGRWRWRRGWSWLRREGDGLPGLQRQDAGRFCGGNARKRTDGELTQRPAMTRPAFGTLARRRPWSILVVLLTGQEGLRPSSGVRALSTPDWTTQPRWPRELNSRR